MASFSSCSSCMEPFSIDIFKSHALCLPCGHTTCRACLLGLETPQCPSCNLAFTENISAMGPNMLVHGMLSLVSEPNTSPELVLGGWCEAVCSCLQNVREIVTTVSDIYLPSKILCAHLPALHDLHELLCALTEAKAPAEDMFVEGDILQHEFRSVIELLSTLLIELVPQLTSLGRRLDLTSQANMIDSTDERVFWDLWGFLVSGCSAFRIVAQSDPSFCEVAQEPFHSQMYAGFHSVLTWLVAFTQSPSWLSITPSETLWHKTRGQLGSILAEPTRCVLRITAATTLPILLSHMAMLPPPFFPLLCWTAHQHVSSLIAMVPDTKVITESPERQARDLALTQMLSVLDDLILCICKFWSPADTFEQKGLIQFVRSPAVLQLLKLIPSLPKRIAAVVPRLVRGSLQLMHLFLSSGKTALQTQNFPGNPLSISDMEVNRDALGLPHHCNPFRSMELLHADANLLKILERHPAVDIFSGLTAQANILQSWVDAIEDMPQLAFEGNLSAVTRSLIFIGKQCMKQVLQIMRKMKAQEIGRPDLSLVEPLELSKLPQQRDMVKDTRLAQLWPRCTQVIQGLMFLVSSFPYAVRRKRLQQGSKFATICAWHSKPGWSAVTELLHRAKTQPNDVCNIDAAFFMATISSTWLNGSESFPQLWMRISLSATLRKLLWLQLGSWNTTPREGLPSQPLSCLEKEQSGCSSLSKGFDSIAGLALSLMNAVSALDSSLAAGRFNNAGGSQGTHKIQQVTHASSSSRDNSVGITQSPVSLYCTSASQCVDSLNSNSIGGSKGPSQVSNPLPLGKDLIHQLMAILLTSVIKICQERWDHADNDLQRESRSCLTAVCQDVQKLHSPDLKAFMMPLLSDLSLSSPTSSQDTCALWEQYAVTHFRGRLLPGCCNFGCTSFDGVSETALKTLLCSGCKKARYCSVKCQMAAWVDGNHKTVCSKSLVVECQHL